jgi:hypothetical protein
VTGGTANALVNVNAVIEIDVIGQAVHALPLDGLIGTVTFANGLEITDVIEQHGVAIHAGFSGRNAGKRGSFHAGMTVTTIDAVVAHVVLVAELYGLRARHTLVGDVRRSRDEENRPKRKTSKGRPSEQTKPSEEIRTAMKNLSHVSVALA